MKHKANRTQKNSVRALTLALLVSVITFAFANVANANCTSQAGTLNAVAPGSTEYFTATSQYKICTGTAWEVIQLTSTGTTCSRDRGRTYSTSYNAPLICSGTTLNKNTCASSGTTNTYYCMPESEIKLYPNSPAANIYFGKSVALSGTSMIVGAPSANSGKGAAYVFVFSSNGWQQQAMLTAANGVSGDNFGQSVAIYGNTAVVGAPNRTVGANANQGGAYIFTRSGSTWTEQLNATTSYPTLTAIPAGEGTASDNMGSAVAIYNGEVAVGSPNTAAGGTVYFYNGNGSTWNYETKLAPAASGNKFGSALSYDSTTILIGAPSTTNGSVYIYTGSLASWSLQTTLTGVASGDKFGSAVFVNSNDAVIGAPGVSTNTGAAYYYSRSGTVWSSSTAITAASAASGDQYGTSVSFYGGNAIIGAPGNATNTGYVSLFQGSGTTWSELTKYTAADVATNKYYGYSVALNSQGFAVGAYGATAVGNASDGAVYMETLSFNRQKMYNAGSSTGTPSAVAGTVSDIPGNTAMVIDGDTLAAGNSTHTVSSSSDGGVWIFRKNTSTGVWSQEAYLAGAAASVQKFGASLALKGNTLIIGAPGDSSGAGAWYYATRSGSAWTLSAKQTLNAAVGASTTSDALGWAVSFDGSTLAVSAEGRAGTYSTQGEVYIYTGTSSFTYAGKVDPPAADVTTTGFYFGAQVAVNGSVLFAGAQGNATNAPKLYVYNKGAGWASGTATNVALSSVTPTSADWIFKTPEGMSFDGTTLAAGAYAPLHQYLIALTYNSTSSAWTDTQISPMDWTQGADFGRSVSVYGNYIATGSDQWGYPGTNYGAVYLFKKSGTGYSQIGKYLADSNTKGLFGKMVALESDQFVAAAPNDTQYAGTTGVLYAYNFASTINSCGYASAEGLNAKFVNNTSTTTDTVSNLVLSNNQTLAVCVGLKGDTITSVSYGGTSKATPDIIGSSTQATPTRAAIFLFPNSSGGTKNSNLVLTATSSTNTKAMLYATLEGTASASYADSSAGAGAAANGTTATTGSVTTTNATDLLLTCAVNNAAADTTSFWGDPMTKVIYDSSSNYGTANANGALSLAFGASPTSSTVTYTGSRNNFTSSDWAIATLAVKSTGTLPTQGGQCITGGSCVTTGAINYDYTTNKLYWCDGANWNQIYSQ